MENRARLSSLRVDEAAYLRLIRGQSVGVAARAARVALSVGAAGYRLGVALRNAGYDRGVLTSRRAAVPVISVGNITLGGTGKTPTVEWVARWFRRRGVRVAILSRGYGQAAGMNDEGRVLEENLPDVPHLQAPDRVALAHAAVEELEAEVLVLDDGFQHRRLARDLDIVLLDALDPFGPGRLFPRGLLREPPRSLGRAGVVILSRADLVAEADRLGIRAAAERQAGPLRWVEARHAPLDLVDFTVRSSPLGELDGRRIAAFCGIGNPEGFRRTLESLGAALASFRAFPDHHSYTAADVAELTSWSAAAGADLVLTTQKDSVKLRAETLGPTPLRALRVGLEFLQGDAIMETTLAPLLPPRM